MLEVLHSPRFCDMAPAAVYATLLDEGVYLCNESTDRSTLIGKRAATTMLPGALVTDDSVTDAAVMGAGQAVVGVAVKQSQVPMESLHPRDQVRMVLSPPSGSDPGTAPPVVTGTVLTTTTPDSSGSRTVDGLVVQADADALAASPCRGDQSPGAQELTASRTAAAITASTPLDRDRVREGRPWGECLVAGVDVAVAAAGAVGRV